jgi:glycosyltransferase involved in cell wall biosynthesis
MRLAALSTHPIQYQAPLFRALSSQPGIDFTALFCHDHGVRPSFDAQFGRVIRFDVPLVEGYTHRFLRNVAPRPSLAPTGLINPEVLVSLAKGEFDAVVVHGYAYVTALLALLGPRRRTRVLLRGESHLLPRRPLPKRFGKQIALRTLFSRIDHFLPIGTANAAYYASFGVAAERMTIAPYSVDNDYFSTRSAEARADRSRARRTLGLPPDVPLFLVAGKLTAGKAPLDVLRAFAGVRANTSCGLVYVGDGPLASRLDDEIARLGVADVYRLGFRNQSELPSIYGCCDVLVLPSHAEAWGLVVNEAMACGMTAIVSDHVGAAPDLADSDAIFPVGDVRQLYATMARLAADGEALAQAKARAARRIADWGIPQTAGALVRGARAALGQR